MSDAPCDVGPVMVPTEMADRVLRAVRERWEAKRHHPAGIEPPDQRREEMRLGERTLMEFYTNIDDYAAACRLMHDKFADPKPYIEAGETFARLIRGS